MAVQILGASCWREYRGGVASPGLNQTNHLAVVSDQHGQLHDCYVKLIDPDKPNLLCEAVGWLLAQGLDIPAPAFAAVIMVPTKELSQHMSLPPQILQHVEYPAWCSEMIRGRSVRQVSKWFVLLAIRRCLSNQDTRAIAALDIWADNQDRNFGNVVRSGDRYIAIDHEALLHSLFPARFERRSIVDAANQILSQDGFKEFCVATASAARKHVTAFPVVSGQISQFVSAIYGKASPLEHAILDFLHSRSAPAFVSKELGVIV